MLHPNWIAQLAAGQTLYWQDPTDERNDGAYRVVEIRENEGEERSNETVIQIVNHRGYVVDTTLSEVSEIPEHLHQFFGLSFTKDDQIRHLGYHPTPQIALQEHGLRDFSAQYAIDENRLEQWQEVIRQNPAENGMFGIEVGSLALHYLGEWGNRADFLDAVIGFKLPEDKDRTPGLDARDYVFFYDAEQARKFLDIE